VALTSVDENIITILKRREVKRPFTVIPFKNEQQADAVEGRLFEIVLISYCVGICITYLPVGR